ncbi:MAG: hypothetical protein AAF699_01735 [Pseudomonadota bacterium]
MSVFTRIVQRYQVAEDPLRTLRRLELVALVIFLLLCMQVVYSAIRLTSTTGPESISPAADSMQIPTVLGPRLLEMESRIAVLERPLFWRGRRPVDVTEVPVESEKSAGQLQGVKLVGVFGSGDRAGVIVMVKDDERRLLVGEQLDGWELADIDQNGIHFVEGGRRETLQLERGVVMRSAPRTTNSNTAIGRAVKPYTQASEQTVTSADQQAPRERVTPGASEKVEEKPRQLGLGPG